MSDKVTRKKVGRAKTVPRNLASQRRDLSKGSEPTPERDPLEDEVIEFEDEDDDLGFVDEHGLNVEGLRIITPLDPDYQPSSGRQGRPDLVSPQLNPLFLQLVAKGHKSVQIPDMDPFSVYQVRGWAKRLNTSNFLPSSVERITVGGGLGENITITINYK